MVVESQLRNILINKPMTLIMKKICVVRKKLDYECIYRTFKKYKFINRNSLVVLYKTF